MIENLEVICQKAADAIRQSATLDQLEELRVRLLGRKGEITQILHGLKELPEAERRLAGQLANEAKQKLAAGIEERERELKRAGWMSDSDLRPDPTLPGHPAAFGHVHILNRTLHEIEDVFKTMGFGVAEGPEVELDYYNFEAMNFPADHPSRDQHDTFFINDQVLLRTHTSPVQVRYMEKHQPPIRVIIPGKTYRNDDDASHSPMFQQVEGLMIDKNVNFSDLKAILTFFIHRMFDKDLKVRFRPGFFPFTEPSAEIDISCVQCRGRGCSLCKGTGWMEILGSGMVHPNVLRKGGIDPQQYTGFAFGMGAERICMLKYGIDNIRYFYENDLRFLQQF